MKENTELKSQIIRKDAKDCLMEVNTQSFSIDKLKIVFSKYNPNLEAGKRTTDRVDIYLNFTEALEFARSILDGNLAKELLKAEEKFKQTGKPWEKFYVISMGGTAKPQKRTDGKAESRILKAQLGNTPEKPVLLIASSGPGDVNDKGLIIPSKGAKIDHSVLIPLSTKDIREIAVAIDTHVRAYIQYQHLHKMWEYKYEPKQPQQNEQNQVYNNQQASYQGQQNNYQQQNGYQGNQGNYQQPNHQQTGYQRQQQNGYQGNQGNQGYQGNYQQPNYQQQNNQQSGYQSNQGNYPR